MRNGGVRGIKDLLSVYKERMRPPQDSVIRAFQAATREVCRIELPRSAVKYSPASKTIALTIAGPHKTEILLQKKNLLAWCKKELGPKGAPEHIV